LVAPFALNALSFIGIIAALLWWRAPAGSDRRLPPEKVGSAIVAGLRFALNNGPLQATLVRAGAFFLFASGLWAMLPLVARDVLNGGPTLYGLLLASIGAGAVAGALVIPLVKSKLGADRTVAAGTIGIALVLTVLALVREQTVAIAATALAGACWIAVLSSLNVSAQTALPNWVRARGLSIFLTVFFGAMSIGSLVWGQLATMTSIATSLLAAAAGAVLLIFLTWAAKLNQGEDIDLAPSAHWPTPLTAVDSANERGPVMTQVSYRVAPADQSEFVSLMQDLARARRRNGGYSWSLMQDAADPGSFIETWYEAAWVDHLRHHERVTGAEKQLQTRIQELNKDRQAPIVRHFLTAE